MQEECRNRNGWELAGEQNSGHVLTSLSTCVTLRFDSFRRGRLRFPVIGLFRMDVEPIGPRARIVDLLLGDGSVPLWKPVRLQQHIPVVDDLLLHQPQEMTHVASRDSRTRRTSRPRSPWPPGAVQPLTAEPPPWRRRCRCGSRPVVPAVRSARGRAGLPASARPSAALRGTDLPKTSTCRNSYENR